MRRADSLEKTLMLGKIENMRKRGQQMLDDIIDSCPSSWSKHQEIVKNREARCAAIHGAAKHRTQLSDSITTTLSCQAPKVIKPTHGFTENQTKEERFLFSSCFSQHNSPFNKRNICMNNFKVEKISLVYLTFQTVT